MKSRFITALACLVTLFYTSSFGYAASNAVNIGSDGITFPDNSVQNKAAVLPSCSSGDFLINSSGAWLCGKVMIVNNGLATCVGGNCSVNSCSKGFSDCDSDPANGCEVNLLSDDINCGMCGTVCSVNKYCNSGNCVPLGSLAISTYNTSNNGNGTYIVRATVAFYPVTGKTAAGLVVKVTITDSFGVVITDYVTLTSFSNSFNYSSIVAQHSGVSNLVTIEASIGDMVTSVGVVIPSN